MERTEAIGRPAGVGWTPIRRGRPIRKFALRSDSLWDHRHAVRQEDFPRQP